MCSESGGDIVHVKFPSNTTKLDKSLIPNVHLFLPLESIGAYIHSGNMCAWHQDINETFLNSSGDDISSETQVYNWTILIMCPLVLFGIGGNLLVIMAISLEKRLQNVTNYFLLSLAVTDFLVSLIVMPFSIINEFTGKWLFGLVLCDLFCTADVLMCTSSILHLCTISLERYIGIRYPLWTKNKSKSVVFMKIVLVWTIAIAITSPITILGLLKPHNVLMGDMCALNNEHFKIYGSIFAFFIPLVIMIIMYGLTVRMLNKQAKLCGQGSQKDGAPMIRRSTSRRHWKSNHNNVSRHENVKYSQSFPVTGSKTNKGRNSYQPLQKRNTVPYPSQESPKTKEKRKSFTFENSLNCDRKNDQSQKKSNNYHPIHKRESKSLRDLVKKHHVAIKAANLLLQRKDSVRKDNSVQTEQKATKVLGVVFLIFIICWAPFFMVNILMALCKKCHFNPTLITAFVWLGYVSSTLNPIIYTIFNRIFKMTFVKLLKCRYNTLHRGKRNLNITSRNGLLNCNSFCASANSASFEESIC
ncbi:5-hydroxytryptamine receptor 2C [Patella vulgata]|uniref:5-hydroxytryptamine receptor 2C n=1 Tax=Patella vulgata TaxID=6465 RepID=UPI00218074CD|nr:5-hydroxytryptamine receptor 2C [Patella vulgata]